MERITYSLQHDLAFADLVIPGVGLLMHGTVFLPYLWMLLGRSTMYEGDVEVLLNAASFLECAVESGFVGRDTGEGFVESILDIVFGEGD